MTVPGRLAALLFLLAGAYPGLAGAETVHSLDQVPRHLNTPEARAFFAEQIEGKPAPDGLGVTLPDGLSAAALAALLVPAAPHGTARLVGARKWRGDLYVAIACTGSAAPAWPGVASCNRPQPAPAPAGHAYLGVIAMPPGAAPRLVAAGDPFAVATPWDGDTGLPGAPIAADGTGDDGIAPQTIDRFDLARYTIAPGIVAFGLRVGWSEGYSGGGAEFTALDLFVIDGTRLKPVLAVPMSASIDIAGDWHPDHTRDHQLRDGSNVLAVTPHLTAGHYDLIVRASRGKWHRVYRWSAAAGAYRAAPG